MSPAFSKRQDFGFTCSAGGTWYACDSGSKFVGCCASDPCSIGCSDGNISPGSFDPDQYGKFPDASCGSGSRFYTCTSGATFWGCCKSNPCSNGSECPVGDLTPAFIDLPAQVQAYQPTGSATSSTTSATSTRASQTTAVSTGSSATSTSSTSASTSATAAAVTQSAHHDKNIAVIAGGAAGGGVALAFLVGLFVYFIMHTKRSRGQHQESLERRQSDLGAALTADKSDKSGFYGSEAPPMYTSPQNKMHAFPHDPHHSQQQQHHEQIYQYNPNPIEPLELPATSTSPRNIWQPHRPNRLSELPTDSAQRSELESPAPSPRTFGTPKTPGPPGGGRGGQPSWTAYSPQRQPERPLGIAIGNVEERDARREGDDGRGYHAV
ncbi:hypothetical protein K458DRAFT_325913 [Lentithecium fluviatile CBS 122367]|uniref:Uncharacterized protein n=1 Tax=Lentithecium fluviatile CBS 122367 TaxID=1168545 RepID=A0A6G1JPL8_9PLEO|nr:hypothetical protein K458DRAFT_325913 [Lentithecium fluviatile CBS 122367]